MEGKDFGVSQALTVINTALQSGSIRLHGMSNVGNERDARQNASNDAAYLRALLALLSGAKTE